MNLSKAFFIDRDGIIVQMIYDVDNGDVHTPFISKQVVLMPGIIKLIRLAQARGYKIIVISNQPNVGLKRMSEENFKKVNNRVRLLLKKKGVILDGEYYCLHHPFAKIARYRKKCLCRKPAPGLLFQAKKDHAIDLKNSYFIGDGANDIIAGHKAKCRTILVGNVIEAEFLRVLENRLQGMRPDYLVKDLSEAAKIIKKL